MSPGPFVPQILRKEDEPGVGMKAGREGCKGRGRGIKKIQGERDKNPGREECKGRERGDKKKIREGRIKIQGERDKNAGREGCKALHSAVGREAERPPIKVGHPCFRDIPEQIQVWAPLA